VLDGETIARAEIDIRPLESTEQKYNQGIISSMEDCIPSTSVCIQSDLLDFEWKAKSTQLSCKPWVPGYDDANVDDYELI